MAFGLAWARFAATTSSLTAKIGIASMCCRHDKRSSGDFAGSRLDLLVFLTLLLREGDFVDGEGGRP